MGLFLEGRILGTLENFEEHTEIIDLHIHLSNSGSRESKELPPAYGNRSVYVFVAGSKNSEILGNEWDEGLLEDREDRDRSSSRQFFQGNKYVFLVARASCSESAQSNLSALGEGKRQGKLEACGGAEDGSRSLTTGDAIFGKASKELRDGRDGAENFELLGIVEVASFVTLSQIASRMKSFGKVYQTKYTTKPRTIRIV